MSQSFSSRHRLKFGWEFDAVFKGNQYRVHSNEFLFLALNNKLDFNRLGLVIGKKSLKLATDRNLVKRLIREAFRTRFLPGLTSRAYQGVDLIVVSKSTTTATDKIRSATILNKMFDELIQKKNSSVHNA